MHDRLRDLRPDAADDAIRAHQPRRRDGLQQMLRDERIDGRHAGDVDDRDFRARLDDPLEQALHHDLRARAVERADERQREDAIPEPDHRRRQLEQFLLLARDDLLARLLECFHREESELIDDAAKCAMSRRRPAAAARRARGARDRTAAASARTRTTPFRSAKTPGSPASGKFRATARARRSMRRTTGRRTQAALRAASTLARKRFDWSSSSLSLMRSSRAADDARCCASQEASNGFALRDTSSGRRDGVADVM